MDSGAKAVNAGETNAKESMTGASPNPTSPARRSELPLRSIVSNWAGLVVNGVLSFVLTPLLVRGLGDTYFAMWMLVTSLLESSWLLDFGMRTTVFRFVARYQGAKQRDALDETFASGFAISSGVAAVILLLSCASLFILPSLFAITGDSADTFRWLLILSGASVESASAPSSWELTCARRGASTSTTSPALVPAWSVPC